MLLLSTQWYVVCNRVFLYPFIVHLKPITQCFLVLAHLLQSMTDIILLSILCAGIILVLIVCVSFISWGFNIFFYTGIMPLIMNPMSTLCTYYETKHEGNTQGKTVKQKIADIYTNNLLLTIPLLLTMVYILNPSSISPNEKWGFSGFDICLSVAFAMLPGFLLLLRLMANPTYRGKSYLGGHLLIKRKFSEPESEIKKVKGNVSSFLGTLIFLTALFLFLEFCADYLSSGSYSTFFDRYHSTMPLYQLVIWIAAYLEVLFLITIYGELILEECEPIIQEKIPLVEEVSSVEEYTPYFQE